jgi:hypothetical protein
MHADAAVPEQWQVQIQTRIQNRASVYLFSDTLSDEQIRETLLKPCRDIERLVLEKGGRVAVASEMATNNNRTCYNNERMYEHDCKCGRRARRTHRGGQNMAENGFNVTVV